MKFKFYHTIVILATFLVGVACFLPKNAHAVQSVRISFVYNQNVYIYDSNEVAFDKHNGKDIHSLAKRGFFDDKGKKLQVLNQVLSLGFDEKTATNYLLVGLDKVVDKMKKEIEYDKIDSQIIFDANKQNPFDYSPSKDGLVIDEDRLYKDILQGLNKSCDFTVKTHTLLQKAVSIEDNKNKTTLKAKFATNYQNSSDNRKSNVRLAMGKFNGMVVKNGEKVSFNEVVGKRTEENGYKQAKVISYGKYTDGVGGGVCQASTTLYNGVLLAGLKIDEWHRHTLKSSYVLPSFDAMVNDNGADLVFTNDSGEDIYLKTFCDDKQVCVEVYGVKSDIRLSRQSVVTKEEKATVTEFVDEKGEYADKVFFSDQSFYLQRPIDGLTSQGFLVGKKDGQIIFKRLIRQDRYQKVDGVLVWGSKTPVQNQDSLQGDCQIKNILYG